jgi:hypothetical protein
MTDDGGEIDPGTVGEPDGASKEDPTPPDTPEPDADPGETVDPVDPTLPCGDNVEVIDLNELGSPTAAGVTYTGDLLPQAGLFAGTCGGGGNEVVLAYRPDRAGDLLIDTLGSEFDSVLYAMSDCTNPESELGCNDDADPSAGVYQSALSLVATPDVPIFIFVDTFNEQVGGLFTLNVAVREQRGLGEECDAQGLRTRCEEGALCADGTCVAGTPPVADLVLFYGLDNGADRLIVEGTDVDGDVRTILLTLLDEAEIPVDLGETTVAELDIAERVDGLTDFSVHFDLDLAGLPEIVAVQVALRDGTGLDSALVRAESAPLPVITVGNACDPALIADACETGAFCDNDSAVCVASAPPVLVSATVLQDEPGAVRAELIGTDAEGDVVSAELTFVDADGADLPLPPGYEPVTDLPMTLDWPVEGQTDFVTVMATRFVDFSGNVVMPAGTAAVRVELVDRAGNQSNSVIADLVDLPRRADGESCDDRGVLDGCAEGSICSPATAVCALADEAVAEFCDEANVEVLVPDVATTVVSLSLNSVLSGSCGGGGSEQVFALTLDELSSVTITTELPGTARGTDTVLYVRSSCADAESELAGGCNDDLPGADYASRQFSSELHLPEVPAGTIYIVADTYSTGGIFDIQASVVPSVIHM